MHYIEVRGWGWQEEEPDPGRCWLCDTYWIPLIGLIGLFGYRCERGGPKTNEYSRPPGTKVDRCEVRGWTCLHE